MKKLKTIWDVSFIIVDKVDIRHSGIEGTVRNSSGQPFANATIQGNGTAKTAVTDLMGVYASTP